MGAMASQITSLAVVYSTICSCTDQRKHQRSAWPVNSPHKGPAWVTRKLFPFDDVTMSNWFVQRLGTHMETIHHVTVCPSNLQWRREIKCVQHYWGKPPIDSLHAGPVIRSLDVLLFCWPEQKSLWIVYFQRSVLFSSEKFFLWNTLQVNVTGSLYFSVPRFE